MDVDKIGQRDRDQSAIKKELTVLINVGILVKDQRMKMYRFPGNQFRLKSDDRLQMGYHQIGRASYKQNDKILALMYTVDFLMLVDFGRIYYESSRTDYANGACYKIGKIMASMAEVLFSRRKDSTSMKNPKEK
jgi:hypothetical protein